MILTQSVLDDLDLYYCKFITLKIEFRLYSQQQLP
jgi:hypothetical protein